jgi:CRISPR/Cas system CMR-associated protein Cmr1 (group 7 of RAMP superfamily)
MSGIEYTNWVLTRELEKLQSRIKKIEQQINRNSQIKLRQEIFTCIKNNKEITICDRCRQLIPSDNIYIGSLFNSLGDEVKCFLCPRCLNVE